MGRRNKSNCCSAHLSVMNRRGFLKNSSAGFGWLAFAGLLGGQVQAATKKPLPQYRCSCEKRNFLFYGWWPKPC